MRAQVSSRPKVIALWMAFIALVLATLGGACVATEETTADDDDGGSGGQAEGGGGAGGMDPAPACDARVPRPQEPEVLIGPAGLEARLVGLMDGAQSEIALMMYQLSCNGCVTGLINAHSRGVHVRVLYDEAQTVNAGAINQLTAAGVEIKPSPAEFNHAHAKVMVIDGAFAVVMSANMNVYSMSSERNYGVIDTDPQDVAQLLAVFERDWNGSGDVDTSCTRLIISPENARERLLDLINGATERLDLAVMYVSDPAVKNAIKAKVQEGVPTRVLLAHPEWIDGNPATAQELSAVGAETKYLYAFELHAKLVMADGVPFVGSENLSTNALENNREVGLLVTEPGPAAVIQEQFEADWAQGTAAP